MEKETYLKAENAVKLLKQKNLKIATAESCTGGLVSAYITSVAGASDIFELGITSYSSEMKNKVLGVSGDLLEKKGAVSRETVLQMAENVKKLSRADIGISVSGVAGPDSSEGHPAGYVFIGIAYKNIKFARLLNIKPESREYVREAAVSKIFDLIFECLKGES